MREKDAPDQIGFLSIGTEGYECEALSRIDFSCSSFNSIAVEENGSADNISNLTTRITARR